MQKVKPETPSCLASSVQRRFLKDVHFFVSRSIGKFNLILWLFITPEPLEPLTGHVAGIPKENTIHEAQCYSEEPHKPRTIANFHQRIAAGNRHKQVSAQFSLPRKVIFWSSTLRICIHAKELRYSDRKGSQRREWDHEHISQKQWMP